MKQIFLIFIITLLIFISCGKEDDGDTGQIDDAEESDDSDDNTGTTDGDMSESEETPDLPTFEDEELLPPPSDSFLIQWGNGDDAFVQDVAVSDNGEILITGAIFDDINSFYKFFVASFSTEGSELWMHQINNGNSGYGNKIALDSQGNIFVAGRAGGSMDDAQSEKGNSLLIKYDKDGILKWIRQWGETAEYELATSVAVDSKDNVIITGSMTADDGLKCNIFLAKYTTAGEKTWIKQWGTDVNNRGKNIVIDDNDNIFVLGTWELEADVFLAKYSTDGTEIWKKQWGTDGNIVLKSMALDNDGNIFITGDRAPNIGGSMSLEKRDMNGELLWRRGLPGTSMYEKSMGNAVAVDKSGNVFVTGFTSADLGVNINAGQYDAFLMKFKNDGEAVWGKLWGTFWIEHGKGVTVDSNGNIVVTGTTDGNLTDASTVDENIFLLSIKSQ